MGLDSIITGTDRRKQLLIMLRQSSSPLSGSFLGKKTGVSRQVIVQDIALLRTQGYPILSTARGYLLPELKQANRLFKLCHSADQMQDELETIVDLGGCIIDVMVNHRVYGKVCAPLNIKNRYDIQMFLNDIKTGKSTPLMNITSGYHFHRISADREEQLNEIENALKAKHYLAAFLPYELEEE